MRVSVAVRARVRVRVKIRVRGSEGYFVLSIIMYNHNTFKVTCSNEISRMSANLISRKHRINMQR